MSHTPNTRTSSADAVVGFLKARWLPILLTVLAVVFIAQNRGDTRVQFLWLHLTWPLWLTLTLVTVVGVVIGYFVARRRSRHK